MYDDYNAMKDVLHRVSEYIQKNGIPKKFDPMVFAVTGTGRVASGALEVLEQLPHIKIAPDELKTLQSSDSKKIYIAQFTQKDLVRHKEGKEFNKRHYYDHPNFYESKF